MSRNAVPALSRKPRPLNVANVKPEDEYALRLMLEWEGPPPDRDVYLWAGYLTHDVIDWLKERKGRHGFGMNREALAAVIADIQHVCGMIEAYERLFKARLN